MMLLNIFAKNKIIFNLKKVILHIFKLKDT